MNPDELVEARAAASAGAPSVAPIASRAARPTMEQAAKLAVVIAGVDEAAVQLDLDEDLTPAERVLALFDAGYDFPPLLA